MLSQPFLASAIVRLPLVDASDLGWCETAATDGYYIYVNPPALEERLADDVMFIIAHEVLHCVLGHIDRRQDRNPRLWNIAIDIATNLLLRHTGMTAPVDALIDETAVNWSAEEIYEWLQNLPANELPGASQLMPKVKGRSRRRSSTSKKAQSGMQQGSDEPGQHASGFDRHVEPDGPFGQNLRAREFPTREERHRIRLQLTQEMKAAMKGDLPGDLQQEILKGTSRRVPWQALLARFVTGLRRDDYRLLPPNKKHIWAGLYLPSIGVPGPDDLVLAVDTSGSISTKDLSEILSELDRLRASTECRLTIVQCDAKIQKVDEFEAYEPSRIDRYRFLGRGGTDFRPVFKWMHHESNTKNRRFDALFYLTDGLGSFPARAPDFPVIWILTDESTIPVPFGTTIHVPMSLH